VHFSNQSPHPHLELFLTLLRREGFKVWIELVNPEQFDAVATTTTQKLLRIEFSKPEEKSRLATAIQGLKRKLFGARGAGVTVLGRFFKRNPATNRIENPTPPSKGDFSFALKTAAISGVAWVWGIEYLFKPLWNLAHPHLPSVLTSYLADLQKIGTPFSTTVTSSFLFCWIFAVLCWQKSFTSVYGQNYSYNSADPEHVVLENHQGWNAFSILVREWICNALFIGVFTAVGMHPSEWSSILTDTAILGTSSALSLIFFEAWRNDKIRNMAELTGQGRLVEAAATEKSMIKWSSLNLQLLYTIMINSARFLKGAFFNYLFPLAYGTAWAGVYFKNKGKTASLPIFKGIGSAPCSVLLERGAEVPSHIQ
jgi:hypothetical protein